MKKTKNLNGFGLAEVLVSVFILAVMLLGLNFSLILAIENNAANFMRNSASKIAQDYSDKLRNDNTTISTGTESECNPNDANDKAIDYVPFRNGNIKYETVWNFTAVPNTNNRIYNLNVTTCYYYKGLKRVSYQTKIYKGKSGL
ncbi:MULTISPECIES: type IV pilus modification PilV family protein [Calditerrivibrio]|uniref:type IV pilus modification PilV family protein n=1 Tax=Calditerrivibrio TaxID=545865 RepID=UPI003C755C54